MAVKKEFGERYEENIKYVRKLLRKYDIDIETVDLDNTLNVGIMVFHHVFGDELLGNNFLATSGCEPYFFEYSTN